MNTLADEADALFLMHSLEKTGDAGPLRGYHEHVLTPLVLHGLVRVCANDFGLRVRLTKAGSMVAEAVATLRSRRAR